MKLKTFFGTNMPAVMDKIRTELGEDVLIISSQRLADGTLKIITAIETETTPQPHTPIPSDLKQILKKHHLPDSVIEHLLTDTHTSDLISFLQNTFQFQSITTNKQTARAYCLVGPHGSGKTTALIKLALSAKLSELNPCVLTTDVVKAGARDQLIAFCKIAQIPFVALNDLNTLNTTLEKIRQHHQFILMDTMGVSYRNAKELTFLKQLKKNAVGLEMLLTLPAGLDIYESADITSAFAQIGANRLIATKMDATRYFGNVLYAAFHSQLPFAAFGTNASVSEAFETPTPQKLAALLENTK